MVVNIDKKAFLVVGSGAREHAISWKLLQSKFVKKLFLAAPNDGFKDLGIEIEFKDFDDLVKKSKKSGVEIVIVGSENDLAKGITDLFEKNGIKCIATNSFWTQLESSKYFAKKFIENSQIKTADFQYITDFKQVILKKPPYVIKANGLCGGKGVKIAKTKNFALKIIKNYLTGEFNSASKSLLIEEFLEGEEISLMSLWDKKTLIHFLPTRDFKKLSDSKNAPNTGGMGSFCPINLTKEQQEKFEIYKKNLENLLKRKNANFIGFLYSGLIWAKNDFYLLEFNTRLGDPETQSLLYNLQSDFGKILIQATNQELDKVKLRWDKQKTATLIVTNKGYPFNPKENNEIKNLSDINVQTFFAGIKKKSKKLFSKGGRVLSLTVSAKEPFQILQKQAQKLKMNNKYYRKDLI